MKSDLDITAQEIRDEHKKGADTDTLWKMFKARLQTSMETNIPTFMLKKRQSQPWITPTIKKMLKKKQRLFKRATGQAAESTRNTVAQSCVEQNGSSSTGSTEFRVQ